MTIDRIEGSCTDDALGLLRTALDKACLSANVRVVFDKGITQDPSLAICATDTLMAIACDRAGWAGVAKWLAPASLTQRNAPVEILQGDFSMIRYFREDALERTYLFSVVEHALGRV